MKILKKLLLFISFVMVATAADGQVCFSKFKLQKNEPFGHFPGRKMLDTKFKVTASRDIKYVFVDWYIINAVGDVISPVSKGIKEKGKEYIKPQEMQLTGPFQSGKSYSNYLPEVITTGQKVTAIPYKLTIIYMGDDTSIEIPITKANIKEYFPKVEWIDYNRHNPAL